MMLVEKSRSFGGLRKRYKLICAQARASPRIFKMLYTDAHPTLRPLRLTALTS